MGNSALEADPRIPPNQKKILFYVLQPECLDIKSSPSSEDGFKSLTVLRFRGLGSLKGIISSSSETYLIFFNNHIYSPGLATKTKIMSPAPIKPILRSENNVIAIFLMFSSFNYFFGVFHFSYLNGRIIGIF